MEGVPYNVVEKVLRIVFSNTEPYPPHRTMWAKRNPENTFNFYVYNDGEWHDVSGTITIPEISVFLSAFVNDSGFLTADDITGLQEALVSGENIKTINGQSIVGSGNLVINGGGTGLDSAFEEITISDPITKNNSGYYTLPSTIYETALTAWQTGRIPVLNVSLSSDTVTLSCPLVYRGYDFVGYFHKQGDTKTHFVCTVGSTSATINVDYEQEKLESGVNIKTINNQSLLGSGNIPIDNIPLSDLEANVASGIVYDVTANNSGATFASLSALLSNANLGTLIPTNVRKGGMQIRFVQTSDNKYVQFRYMGTATTGSPNPFLDTANWQGVDNVPTAGSDNLVKSGGVVDLLYDSLVLNINKNVVVTSGGQFLVDLKNADDIKIVLSDSSTATVTESQFLYLYYPHSSVSVSLPAFADSELTYQCSSANKGYPCTLNVRPNKVATAGTVILDITTNVAKNYDNIAGKVPVIEQNVSTLQSEVSDLPTIRTDISQLQTTDTKVLSDITDLNTFAKKSALSFIENGILITPYNYYTRVTTLDTNKKYALAITTATSGQIKIQAGTAMSISSMVDTIATETFVSGVEKFIYGYTPTGNYDYFRLDVANNYTLKLYEYVDAGQAQQAIQDSTILKDCFLNEYEMNGWCVVPLVGWKNRMLDGTTGDVSSSTNYINKSIHTDFFQLSGKGLVVVKAGYQFRLYTYNSSKEFESYTYKTSTVQLDFDGSKYYKICLFNGSANTPATANNIKLEESNNICLYNVTKLMAEMPYKPRANIYGIRIDNSLSTNNVTRIADAIGLKNDYTVGSTFQLNHGLNDFDNIFPWCEMRLCNVKIVNGEKVITYQGETGFTRDGSNGDVMVEIPKFYSMRTVKGDIEEILISGQKYSGFEVEPVFIDSNGKELNFVYCGAYLTHIEDGALTSKTGVLPTTNKSLVEYRQFTGEMYDFAMLQCLQKLISIEMCALDVQSKLGCLGWLPYDDVKAYENATGVNSAYFYSNEVNDQNYPHLYKVDYLFVGEGISVRNSSGTVENRKITALGDVIEYQEGTTNRHRRLVTFTGEPVNLTADTTLLTGHGQESGLSDGVLYHTGRAGLNEYATVDQFKYRNIEGLWGNCGEYMDGIRVKNAEYYFTFDQSKYSSLSNYTKLPYDATACVNNVNKYNWKYIVIKKMGYDRKNPNVNLPIAVTGYAAVLPVYYSCNICVFNDEDYSGQSTVDVEFVGVSSLAWDAGRFNGPYTYRFWQREDSSQWLYSTRMIYRSE